MPNKPKSLCYKSEYKTKYLEYLNESQNKHKIKAVFHELYPYENEYAIDVVEMDCKKLHDTLLQIKCTDIVKAREVVNNLQNYFRFHGIITMDSLREKYEVEQLVTITGRIVLLYWQIELMMQEMSHHHVYPHILAAMVCEFYGIRSKSETFHIRYEDVNLRDDKLKLPYGRIIDLSDKPLLKDMLEYLMNNNEGWSRNHATQRYESLVPNGIFKAGLIGRTEDIVGAFKNSYVKAINDAIKASALNLFQLDKVNLMNIYDSGLLHYINEQAQKNGHNASYYLYEELDNGKKQMLNMWLAEFGNAMSVHKAREMYGITARNIYN